MADLYSACAKHAASANRHEMELVGNTKYDANHGSVWCDLGDHWTPVGRIVLTLRKKHKAAR